MSVPPLHGISVLELATVIAGPYAGALLRGLGAEVVKIEPPGEGDAIRKWTSPRGPAVFNQMNAGKQSVAVNLSSEQGPGLIRKLLPSFDVLIHNMRPGRMEQLGLSGGECLAINPSLIYLSLSGFGGIGPAGSRPGYDGIGQAFAGLLGLLTAPGERPQVGPALADLTAGLVCAAGVLTGLFSRERTGQGLVVETSLIEAVVALIADQFTHYQATGQAQDSERRSRLSQIFSLRTADDRFVIVHISTSEKFYRSLLAAMGREDLLDDERFQRYEQRVDCFDELQAEFESTARQRPLAEWEELLSTADVPHSPVMTIGEVLDHPQMRALNLFSNVEPHSGIRMPAVPWRFDSERPTGIERAPILGEHTRSVLGRIVSSDELDEFSNRGVIEISDDTYDT